MLLKGGISKNHFSSPVGLHCKSRIAACKFMKRGIETLDDMFVQKLLKEGMALQLGYIQVEMAQHMYFISQKLLKKCMGKEGRRTAEELEKKADAPAYMKEVGQVRVFLI